MQVHKAARVVGTVSGVDLLFVISAFFIAGLLVAECERIRSIRLANAYPHRAGYQVASVVLATTQ